MAERNDWDRERGRWDRNRNREYGERGRDDWDRERGREYYGHEPRWDESGRGSQWDESHRYRPERGDYDTRGDWGRQGSWGAYGNRPDFERENEWRRGQGTAGWGHGSTGEWEPGGPESSFGRFGGFGILGRLGGYGGGGGMGSYGGGMGTYSQRGQFAGRGPKNWQRSDERIKDDVSERLSDHPDIDASEIEVQVKNAEVILIGTVDHRDSKRLAEDIAQCVSGVKDVHNQIHVEKPYMPEQGETGMTRNK
jgi:BON domain